LFVTWDHPSYVVYNIFRQLRWDLVVPPDLLDLFVIFGALGDGVRLGFSFGLTFVCVVHLEVSKWICFLLRDSDDKIKFYSWKWFHGRLLAILVLTMSVRWNLFCVGLQRLSVRATMRGWLSSPTIVILVHMLSSPYV
jgi:hypothetical protein